MLLPIESYRQPWESDENWELRREFITANDDKVEEVALISLSQVFVNMLLKGCSYNSEVWSQVDELTKNVERLPELLAKRQKTRNILFKKEPKPSLASKKPRYPPLVLR
ncbi:partner of xrn-2 protein 1-like [Rhipicephalus sanguineus]|uniref:partner of xrn-2 protein 1-like n=1 Tax=Rhipicephalus sanguineus TaxID=34632 RepID=UPI0018932006|nr:partner of xrn-2 protein 1-like [Rhipicephalus sanguineus]